MIGSSDGRHQYGGEIYYVVINRVADEHAKLGTQYSLPKIAFVKAVIRAFDDPIHDDPSYDEHALYLKRIRR